MLDLLGRERRSRAVTPRGVADQAGEVADQEDHLVAQILQLSHLVEHHRVADVNVRRRGIQSELDAQGPACGFGSGQLLDPLILRQQFFGTAQRGFEGLPYTIGYRFFCNKGLIHKGFLGCPNSMHRYTSAHIAVSGF